MAKVLCRLCDFEFDSSDPSEGELLAHLFECHMDLLISLCYGLKNKVEE
ncbi:MAG: hypothetical protein QXT84_01575 [Candidatus Bathyarchaeia archaeon]